MNIFCLSLQFLFQRIVLVTVLTAVFMVPFGGIQLPSQAQLLPDSFVEVRHQPYVSGERIDLREFVSFLFALPVLPGKQCHCCSPLGYRPHVVELSEPSTPERPA